MTGLDLSRQQTASLSDVGMVRSENQDACSEIRHPVSGAQLLVVADGMGGHQGGATASRMAIETVGEVFRNASELDGELLREALEEANDRIYRASHERPELHGMGTTVVALLIGPDGATWVGHVGDSRAYQLRDGQLHPITADHSAVAEMERRGMITAEEAAVHPRRNELLRSIGVESEVDVDVAPVEIHDGDQFLLCSDGLCGVLGEQEMTDVLLRQPPQQAVRSLVDAANARGGPDNVTVLVTSFAAPRPITGVEPEVAPQRNGSDRSQVRRLAVLAALVGVLLVVALAVLVLTSDQFEADFGPALQAVPDPAGRYRDSGDQQLAD